MTYKQNSMLGRLVEPFKFAQITGNLNLTDKSKNIRYLVIGCGNHSKILSRKYLPNIEYWRLIMVSATMMLII